MAQWTKVVGVQDNLQNHVKASWGDFPGGAVVKNLPVSAGDMG